MRINNWKHVPWIVFVLLATIAACILYAGNFHPALLPSWIRLPSSLIQTPTEHHTVGGTPLGLWFGAISLAIFVFAILLSVRKKIPLWRVGTVQRWLRAHIWLTILTIPLVILHSGFRLGGPMTTFLVMLYAIVMVSGFYGLFLQHIMPRLMKERLPAETVFEQIPHIRSQLAAAAEKMRDSFKTAPPKKSDPGAPAADPAKTASVAGPVMASTKGELSTPAARAKSATGSPEIAAPVVAAATTASDAPVTKPAVVPAPVANAAVTPAAPKPETIGTPTARSAGRAHRSSGRRSTGAIASCRSACAETGRAACAKTSRRHRASEARSQTRRAA
jgi:Zn-dependent protease with chaperone function